MREYDNIKRGKDPYADADATKAHLEAIGKVYIPFSINQTDLLAGTSYEIVSPVEGAITGLRTIVQAAVTTGGDITVEVNTVAVSGLSIAVANSATKGTRGSDSVAADEETAQVSVGDRIEIQPSAAFDTAGAVNGVLEITL